jgi:hypothetical protein
MSELEQPTRELPAAPPPPPAPERNLDRATSVLAGLRVEHTATRGGRTKVFPIPHHTAVMTWMRPTLDEADGEFAKNS